VAEVTARVNLAFATRSAWFASRLPGIRRIVRPIYMKLGIIPEIALAAEFTEPRA
jgi:hypothetical protein